MIDWKEQNIPMSEETLRSLRTGDGLLLNGLLYTARDMAHARIKELIDHDFPPPILLKNQFLYYCGPSPKPFNKIIGSAGPTTSSRMDDYSEIMLKAGVRGMIGKGKRDEKTRQLLMEYGAIYFATFGGAGAFLGKRIIESTIVAFPELGAEAVYQLVVKEFPVFVVNDTIGGDLYELAVNNRSRCE